MSKTNDVDSAPVERLVIWPQDGSPTSFADIVDPLRDAVDHLYELQRQNKTSDVPYGGLDIGEREQAGCLSCGERLKASSLKWEEEDQGRDPMRVVLSLAVQLGIEQGRRMWVAHTETERTIRQIQIKHAT